jgi:hypothetical protein
MSIPGLALFYGGLVRSKNMLSVLMQVFYTVCIAMRDLGGLYGYSLAFTGGSDLHRRLLEGLHVAASRLDSMAATFSVDANISELDLLLLPDDLRRDHAGPHRRRLCRAHEVRGGRAVRPALGDADLLPDGPHGLVLGRSGR